jgi:hypothetical protein
MTYIRPSLAIGSWPYDLARLGVDFPNVSFPANPTPEDLAPFGIFPVVPTIAPPLDPPTQRLEEVYPILSKNEWLQNWRVVDLTPEEQGQWQAVNNPPNYQGFYDALIASPVYQSIRTKAALFQPLLAAATEFIAAFGDAKAGRPNPDAIRMTVWNLFYWLQPSSQEVAMLQQMMSSNNLAGLYPLEIPAPILAAFESQPNPFKFYESILSSNFYTTKLVPIILSGASSIPGDATTIMGFAIKDAQGGLVPIPVPGEAPNALQSALWLWVAAVGPLLEPADLAEIQGLLEAANLADLYTLTPPQQ